LYTFSKFIESHSALLLSHDDESSRIWHKRFGHLISYTCNKLERKYWLMVYKTSISPGEYVKDMFSENTLKRNSTKESLGELMHL
jgi:hypothetical protein